jgi:hypothetical protein
MSNVDNSDGLDIPEFLRREKWVKRAGYRKAVHVKHRRKTAKEKKFSAYAERKARRRRAAFEWR